MASAMQGSKGALIDACILRPRISPRGVEMQEKVWPARDPGAVASEPGLQGYGGFQQRRVGTWGRLQTRGYSDWRGGRRMGRMGASLITQRARPLSGQVGSWAAQDSLVSGSRADEAMGSGSLSWFFRLSFVHVDPGGGRPGKLRAGLLCLGASLCALPLCLVFPHTSLFFSHLSLRTVTCLSLTVTSPGHMPGTD